MDDPDLLPAHAGVEGLVRRLMSSGLSPEEYAARNGRNVRVSSLHRYRYADPAAHRWAHRLAEILRDPVLLEQCEEQHLTPEELEGVRAPEPAIEG